MMPFRALAPSLFVVDHVLDGLSAALGELFEVADVKALRPVVGHWQWFSLAMGCGAGRHHLSLRRWATDGRVVG
jgi:hypothetical protein